MTKRERDLIFSISVRTIADLDNIIGALTSIRGNLRRLADEFQQEPQPDGDGDGDGDD